MHKYYLGLHSAIQLFILFMVNGIFWFVAWEFYTWYFNEAHKTLLQKIEFAAWMSLVITIPLNWKKFKSIFQHKHE